MEQLIRPLHLDDFSYVEDMKTGITDDYVKRLFPKLVAGNNSIFGLFADDRLAAIAGYSVFAGHYAMLGRMRSDERFRGRDLATRLTAFVTAKAFEDYSINWVGANTQEKNAPARRVLEKSGFLERTALIGATAKDVSTLLTNAPAWQKITDLSRKKAWITKLYIKTGAVFPYECYYNFPASEYLFTDKALNDWAFYENEAASRMLILKVDIKKYHYLHVIYPWNDVMSERGLWETVVSAQQQYADRIQEKPLIWLDLTKDAARTLPALHSFELPSPWLLYGMSRQQWTAQEGM